MAWRLTKGSSHATPGTVKLWLPPRHSRGGSYRTLDRLVVKVTNLERYPNAAERLRGVLRRIDGVLIDRHLGRVETSALMR